MPVSKENYLSNVWKEGIFDGRVVFCTGGAGDICSAQVRALVHLGANACIIGRNKEKTQRVAKDIATCRSGAKVIGIGEVDVRSKESLVKAVEVCVKELGSIDICICGAAGNFLAPITQLSENAFKSVIDIDLLGSYNTVKACLPHLVSSANKFKAQGKIGARLLFVSATLHYVGLPFQTHAAAAKAGIDTLSNSCAIELGPRGITSNVIAPGGIAGTEGLERLSKKEDREDSARRVPTGRWGYVKDIADGTVFLCSEAGDYVNGHNLVVDGGAWRVGVAQPGGGQGYPDFLLSDKVIDGVKGMKKSSKI